MSIWLPMLPIDLLDRRRRRCGSGPEPGLRVLVETVSQREVIVHACHAARRAGLRPGLALSAARAACRGGAGDAGALQVGVHDPHRVRRALMGIALWCHRFSPVVAVEDDAGLALDATGCTHLFGGATSMADRVQKALAGLGFESRIAVAPTFAGARAVARFGTSTVVVVQPGEMRRALEPLPVEALGLDADAVQGLAEVNIRRAGELIALPRPAIAARFGVGVLRALDQATGRGESERRVSGSDGSAGGREALVPIRPVDPLRVEQVFDGPSTSLESLGLVCRDLLAGLCGELERREQGLVSWTAHLHRADLAPLGLAFRHGAPSRDPRHLWRLLEPRLERAHLGFGVEGITLSAMGVQRMAHAQACWWPGPDGASAARADASRSHDALIDALVNRLGHDAVLRADLVPAHLPERAWAFRGAHDPAPPASTGPGACGGEAESPAHGDRPTRLFHPSLPARVIALHPEGPVSRVEWRGGIHRVSRCLGPERIRGPWWEGAAPPVLRDYFKVCDEQGQWLWLCRDVVDGRWMVQGVWS